MANTSKKSEFQWDLSLLYKGDDDPRIEKDIAQVKRDVKKFVNKWKDRDDYLNNVNTLKAALDDYEELMAKQGMGGDPSYYFWLRSKQDQADKHVKAWVNKLTDLETQIINDIQFFEMKISHIPKQRQDKFLKSPTLKPYHYFLSKKFKEAKHLLSEPQERIINLKENTSHTLWERMVSELLAKEEREIVGKDGKKKKVVLEDLLAMISDKDKKVRDRAAEAFNDILHKITPVAEAELNAILSNKKIDDELRGFKRADEQRHLSDGIDTKVVDTLVEAVESSNDLAKKYYKLKAQLMGQSSLAYHERNVEVGSINKKFDYPYAERLVLDVFKDLDSEFHKIMVDAFDEKRVDVYPRQGKYGGAFCVHGGTKQPVYVLLNYTGQLRDVTTLAHELGHAIHNELSRKQHSLYFGSTLATAEVASQFLEDFVLERLMQDADKELELSILMSRLNDDISALYRQTACYVFEQKLHKLFREKGFLSHEDIGSLFQKHMESYMGPAVEQSDGSENWWVYWSHIRRFFYNYSYASGILIAKALQRMVREDKDNISKVKGFLAAGKSDTTENIFADVGIDISKVSFWRKGITEIDKTLKRCEKLARELDKI